MPTVAAGTQHQFKMVTALRPLCGVVLLLQPEEVGIPSQTILHRSHPLVAASTRHLDVDVEDLLLAEDSHPAEVHVEVAAVADAVPLLSHPETTRSSNGLREAAERPFERMHCRL